MTHKYGKPLIGVALGTEKLFDGADADWDSQWVPSAPKPRATLWRYMSLAKFCSLLDQQALFFALVGNMADRYEGFIYPPAPRQHEVRLQDAERSVRIRLHKLARAALVNCWTASRHESSLMWETYAGEEGVAVRTTFERLQKSIRSAHQLPVTLGRVNYVDYRRERVPRLGWAPLFHKRMEYHGEGEVRAILPGPAFEVREVSLDVDIPLDPDVAEQGGRNIPVNLDILVKQVVLPPHAKPWFAKVVKSVMRQSRVSAPVARSAIESPPHKANRRDIT